MATEAYEVVGALRELLQSQERREQFKVQTALQAMQFAQAKKMQDVQLAGQQLQFLQTVNTQMKQSTAAQFINDTGFGVLYSPTEDEEERTEAVTTAYEKLTKAPNINKKTGENKGGYGFSGEDANRIVAAMWAHKAGSHEEILSIADELNTKLTSKETLSTSDDKFVKAFVTGGYLSPSEYEYRFQESGQLKSAASIVQNTQDIAAEMYEYGKGEFEIQRDIGMFEPKDVGVDWSAQIAEYQKRGETPRAGGASISPQVAEINQLNTSISKKENERSLIELELDNLRELSQSNLISNEQSERLEAIPLQMETFDEEISSLSEQINTRRKDLSVSSALAAKEALQQTGTEAGSRWADDVDIKQLSELLAKYDPSVLDDIVEGKPLSIFSESMSYGGRLEDAPLGDKYKLWSLSKKIQEAKDIGNIKTRWKEDIVGKVTGEVPAVPGFRR